MKSVFEARCRNGRRLIAVAVITLGCFTSISRAETIVTGITSPVRDAIVALSIADAAMPVALAVATAPDARPAFIPVSSDAMKPETASAMAAMKTASARGANYDRRVRTRDPFVLMLGIAY